MIRSCPRQACATRAITINARTDAVWPWVAQLGQGRGRLQSYDWAENVVGCDIHSVQRIVADWQSIGVGDALHLHPDEALTVTLAEPRRALVLRGAVPIAAAPTPYDFTWAFVLRPSPGGATRLVGANGTCTVAVGRRFGQTGAASQLRHEPEDSARYPGSSRTDRDHKTRWVASQPCTLGFGDGYPRK